MSDPLCCCEYIDKNGRPRHLIQCLCDCQDVDLACTQLCSCKPEISLPQFCLILGDTIEDRCRMPSFRPTSLARHRKQTGARKIKKLSLFTCYLVHIFLIYVASYCWTGTIIVLGVFYPLCIYLLSGFVRIRIEQAKVSISQNLELGFQKAEGSLKRVNQSLANFQAFVGTLYTIWLVNITIGMTIIHRLYLYEIMLSVTGYLVIFLMVKRLIFINKVDGGTDFLVDILENENYSRYNRGRYCMACTKWIGPGHFFHSKMFNCCVRTFYIRNYLLVNLLLVLVNIYSIHLSVTSICTPRFFLETILIPSDCSSLFGDELVAYVTVMSCLMSVKTALLLVHLIAVLLHRKSGILYRISSLLVDTGSIQIRIQDLMRDEKPPVAEKPNQDVIINIGF